MAREIWKKVNASISLHNILVFSNIVIGLIGLIVSLMAYYSTSFDLFEPYAYISDSLYIPSLYRDWVRGVDLSGWSLTPAPYFFPDMLLYFLAGATTPSFHAAIRVYGVIQYLIFILGLMFFAKQVLPCSYGACYGIVTLMGIFFLVSIEKLQFHSQLIFLSAYHAGIVIVIPVVLALSYRIISSSRLKLLFVCGSVTRLGQSLVGAQAAIRAIVLAKREQ